MSVMKSIIASARGVEAIKLTMGMISGWISRDRGFLKNGRTAI
jgi:hypothetical protein